MTTRDPPQFSVTCRSDDEAVIRCLGALANYVERRRPGGRPSGAIVERGQERAIRLRFTYEDARARFLALATDLFGSRWMLCEGEDGAMPSQFA